MGGRHLAWTVLCLLVCLPPSGHAQDRSVIESVECRITVLSNMYSQEEIHLSYRGISGTVLGDEFRIPGEIGDLKVMDSLGPVDFSKRKLGNLTVVRFYFRTGLKSGKRDEVTISYVTSNFTSKTGNLWRYSSTLIAGSSVESWAVMLALPGDVELYMPSGDALLGLRRIYRSSGRTVCEWRAADVSSLPIAIGYSPAQEGRRPRILVYLGVVGIIMISVLAGFLVHTILPSRKEVPKAVEIAIKLLEDRERRIVRELAGGQKLTQAELVKLTKLSKATVSRAVVELERRKIVAREPSGRVIRVKLQDWILET